MSNQHPRLLNARPWKHPDSLEVAGLYIGAWMGLSAFTRAQCIVRTQVEVTPLPSRHALVEDLASNCRKKNPLCPNPFTLSCPHRSCLVLQLSLPQMHTLGALLCLRRPLCYLRSVHGNGKESQGWLSIAGDWNAHTVSQQETRAMKVGLATGGFSSQHGSILVIWQWKMHWYSFAINTISQGGV